MRPESLGKLTGIFRAMFNQPHLELSNDLTAADVPGWDSLKHVNLMVTIESEFGIRFSNTEIANLADVGELIALISEKTGEANA
jgi:acyl carrier protein